MKGPNPPTSLVPDELLNAAVPLQQLVLSGPSLWGKRPIQGSRPEFTARRSLSGPQTGPCRPSLTPQNIGKSPSLGGLSLRGLRRGSAVAKLALRGISSRVRRTPGPQGYEQVKNAVKILKDPKSTPADKVQGCHRPGYLVGAVVPSAAWGPDVRASSLKTQESRARVVGDINDAFPKLFFNRAGMTPEEFVKTTRRSCEGRHETRLRPKRLPKSSALTTQPPTWPASAWVNLALGRMVAEEYTETPSAVQKVLPPSLRIPPKQGGGIEFKPLHHPSPPLRPPAKPEEAPHERRGRVCRREQRDPQ